MKKIAILLTVVLAMLFAFTACGKDSSSTDNGSNSQASTNTQDSTQTQTSTSVDPLADYESVYFNVDAARKAYVVGSQFSLYGIVGKGVKADGKEAILPVAAYTCDYSAFDSSKVGEYEIKLKAGEKGSATFKVTVSEKCVPSENVLNVKIDAAYAGQEGALENGAYNYTSFENFVSIATLSGVQKDVVKNVTLAPGEYVGKLTITANLANMTITGESAETTIISYGDCSDSAGGTDNSATVTIKGENFKVKNVTFKNSYDYNGDTKYKNKQAVAVLADADKCVFENCVFYGYQDTLEAKSGRQYYKNCTIMGCIDYIFGNNSTSLFENCEIKTLKRATSNEYCITAQKGNKGTNGQLVPKFGYVFMNCRLTAEEGVTANSTSLGRPWRADATVAYINCEMGAHISTFAYGSTENKVPRYNSMSGGGLTNLPENAHFYEFGNTGAGAVTAQLNNDFTMLTDVSEYTMANIFAEVNGMVTYTGAFNPVA